MKKLGAVIRRELASRAMRQFELAREMGVQESYLSAVVAGGRRPSPDWVERVADALRCSDAARGRLHRAAALDRGYRVDLGTL